MMYEGESNINETFFFLIFYLQLKKEQAYIIFYIISWFWNAFFPEG